MAVAASEQYTLEYWLLKNKYKSRARGSTNDARILVYCREVERVTGTRIAVVLPRRGPATFTIDGQSGAIKKAVEYIQGEFVPRQKLNRPALQPQRVQDQAPLPPPSHSRAQQGDNQAPQAIQLPPSPPPPSPPPSESSPPPPSPPQPEPHPPPRPSPPQRSRVLPRTDYLGHSGTREAAAPLREAGQQLLGLTDPETPYLLTTAALQRHDILTGTCELRQFACGPCQKVWWRIVPVLKPVSRCYGEKQSRGRPPCGKQRYDALPRDKEYGVGRYICQVCGHTFYSKCQATSDCICFGENGTRENPLCGETATKPYIHPRFNKLFQRPRTTGRRHWCDHCHGMGQCPNFSQVVYASFPHDSTGSTASTFLTQQTELEEDDPPWFDYETGEVTFRGGPVPWRRD